MIRQTMERNLMTANDTVRPNGRRSPAKGRKTKAPKKSTLNLAFKDQRLLDWKRALAGVLTVLILATVFGKFAVMDRFDKLSKAEAGLTAMKTYLDETRRAYADYDEVREQYDRCHYAGCDKTTVDRLDVLNILERQVFPVCNVTSLSVSGDTVTLSLSDLDLKQVSHLIVTLEAEPLVERVYVPVTEEGAEQGAGTASMTVYLVDAATVERGGETQ